VAFAAPCSTVLWFVWQRGECETAVCEPHALSVIAENLVSGFDYVSLMLRRCLPARFFNASQQNQLVHLRHDATVAANFHTVNLGVWWQKLFEGYLNPCLFVCATRLQGITRSRATRLLCVSATRLHSPTVGN